MINDPDKLDSAESLTWCGEIIFEQSMFGNAERGS